jgi:pimeloyl-ACP methyl ester carboxylesterase
MSMEIKFSFHLLQVLKKIPENVPVLFIAGTKDKMCPIDHLKEIQKKMKATSEIYPVEDGDHSLRVTKAYLKRHNTSQTSIEKGIAQKIVDFLDRSAQTNASTRTASTERQTPSIAKAAASSKRPRK